MGLLKKDWKKIEWLACGEYSIADMAIMPWLRFPERQGVNIDDYPRLRRWRDADRRSARR